MAAKRYYGVRNHPDPGKNGVYESWDECSAVVKGQKGVQYKGFGSREEADGFCGATVEAAVSVKRADPDADGTTRRNAMQSLEYLRSLGVMTADAYRSTAESIRALYPEAELRPMPDPTRVSASPGVESPGSEGPDGGVIMYVDGSYNPRSRQCGFGVHILGAGTDVRGHGRECVLYGSVPEENGGRNVEGEVTAAWVGLQALARMVPPGTPVTVYHDYEGIGKWADGEWNRNKSYTQAYADMVERVRRNGLDVSFVHVKGHTGVEGNEVVDRLAKMGCGVPFPGERDFNEDMRLVPGMDKPERMDVPVYGSSSTAASFASSGFEMG